MVLRRSPDACAHAPTARLPRWLCCAAAVLATVAGARAAQAATQATFADPAPRVLLPARRVGALASCADGFLWVGTDAGLARFDGASAVFASGENEPRGPVDVVRCARDGGLLATTRTPLAVWRRGPSLADRWMVVGSAPPFAVRALVEDEAGTLWVGGDGGLERRDRSGTATVSLPFAGPITALAVDAHGHLWMGTDDGVVVRDARGSRVVWRGDSVTALTLARDGQIWAATEESGPVRVRGDEVRTFPERWSLEHGLDPRTRALHAAADGVVWVGTGAGLARIDEGQRFSVAVHERLLPSVRVNAVATDREGGVWVGSDAGLVHVRTGAPFRLLASPAVSGKPVFSLAATDDGSVWMTPEGSSLVRLREDTLTVDAVGDRIGGWDLRALAPAAGRLWALGMQTGLFVSQVTPAAVATKRPPLPLDARETFTAVLAARDGALWIGTSSGRLLERRGESWTSHGAAQTGCAASVTRIREDAHGRIWIATDGAGLCVHAQPGATGATFRQAAAHPRTVTALTIAGDTVWLGTRDLGIARYREGQLAFIGRDRGLDADTIGHILPVGDDALWITSHTGIVRVGRAELEAVADGRASRVDPLRFGPGDGLPTGDCVAGWTEPAVVDQRGRLWVATLKGVVRFERPDRIAPPPLPAPIIEDVTVDGVRFAPGETRATEDGDLVARYVAPVFAERHRLRLRHSLVGRDPDWRESPDGEPVRYEGVPPGQYELRVQASYAGHPGRTSLASFRLTLRPPWRRSPLFRGAVAAAAAATVLLGIWWRRRLRLRRAAELADERRRIARDIHDTLEQTFVAMRLQLAATGKLAPGSGELGGRLELLGGLVRRAMTEARAAIWALRSDAPAADLSTRVAIALGETMQGTNTALGLHTTGKPYELSAEAQNELLRVLAEAVTNALKHAAPSRIDVELRYGETAFQLRVHDDGSGYDAARAEQAPDSGHFGLQGMRERAQRLGGGLTVEGGVGRGTLVVVEIPLARRGREEPERKETP